VVELPGAEGVSVRGVDRFRPGRLDSETEVEVTLAGLPRWAARPLEDRIARAAGALIQPNVGQLLDAVHDLLAAERSAA
jgi:hypothetical protein